jgi:hypothetical protein
MPYSGALSASSQLALTMTELIGKTTSVSPGGDLLVLLARRGA